MTDYNVTVGYRPTLGVTQQASGIVGPAGPAVGSTTSINTTGIAKGTYFLKVIANDVVETQKISIQ